MRKIPGAGNSKPKPPQPASAPTKPATCPVGIPVHPSDSWALPDSPRRWEARLRERPQARQPRPEVHRARAAAVRPAAVAAVAAVVAGNALAIGIFGGRVWVQDCP